MQQFVMGCFCLTLRVKLEFTSLAISLASSIFALDNGTCLHSWPM